MAFLQHGGVARQERNGVDQSKVLKRLNTTTSKVPFADRKRKAAEAEGGRGKNN